MEMFLYEQLKHFQRHEKVANLMNWILITFFVKIGFMPEVHKSAAIGAINKITRNTKYCEYHD